MAGHSFEDLLAEGSAVPVDGWDSSWFQGRATEERPPWAYARMLRDRMAALEKVPGAAALDLQTGGGEVLATIPAAPPTLIATESWPPNLELARRSLAALGARVVYMADELDELPFGDASFDLVVSRHPFDDIGAIVAFLRKVIWIVPDFTVAAYRDRLRDLHDQIEARGPFIATSVRFLIEARKPART